MISYGRSTAYVSLVHCQRQKNVYCFVYCCTCLLKAST